MSKKLNVQHITAFKSEAFNQMEKLLNTPIPMYEDYVDRICDMKAIITSTNNKINIYKSKFKKEVIK